MNTPEIYKSGPTRYCVRGLWTAPDDYPGKVSDDCMNWREATEEDLEKLRPWLDLGLQLL